MKSECCNSSHQCPLKYYTNFYWKSTKVHSSTAPNNQCTTTTTTTTTTRWVQNTRQCSREAKHLFSPQVWNHGRSQDLTHSTHTVLCGQHVCSPSPPKQLGDLVTKACLYAVDESLCGWNVLQSVVWLIDSATYFLNKIDSLVCSIEPLRYHKSLCQCPICSAFQMIVAEYGRKASFHALT